MFSNFKEVHLSRFYFQANRDGDGNGSNADNNQSNQSDNNSNALTFESWLSSQPDDVKTKVQPLFNAHVEKLQNTVKATREERDEFSKQLRDATNKLTKDSDERKRLEEIADKYDEATRRADFFEDALSNNCHNPKAAYAIAKAENLFTKAGLPDWKKIEEVVPEFFGDSKRNLSKKKTAGAGNDKEPQSAMTMNDWIRAEARK